MIGRNSVRRFTQDCILLGVVYLRHALLKRPIVASPAGLEPATCGLEIRCCYPAELRGRDLKAFTEDRLCLPAAGRRSFPRPELRQAMLDISSSRSFRPM